MVFLLLSAKKYISNICIWVWYTEKKHMFLSIFIAISDLHIKRTVVKKIRRNGFK